MQGYASPRTWNATVAKLSAIVVALCSWACASSPKPKPTASNDDATASAQDRLAPSAMPALSAPVPDAQANAGIPYPRFAVPVQPDRPSLGPDDAPVTVVLFSDFECPYCAQAQRTLDALDAAHPGKIRRVYQAFPLSGHPNAMLAALMAESALDQGRFWPFYRTLFSQARLDPPTLWRLAGQAGLDLQKLRADLQTLKFAGRVERDLALAKKLGVQATPVFFINGRRVEGSASLSVFSHYVDQETRLAAQLPRSNKTIYQTLTEHGYTGLREQAPEAERVELSAQGAPSRGPEDAPVTIVAFSDFECPFCVRGNQELARALAHYPEKVRVVFRHLPLGFHAQGQKAARLGVLAQKEGKFWAFHDALYGQAAPIDDEVLTKTAAAAGLSPQQIESALRDTDGALLARVQEDIDLAKKLGIRGTPAYFINGSVKRGVQDELNLRLDIRRELERVNAL